MPQDATCPSCTHLFPVTEARQAFTVPCPKCEVDLIVEFKKPSKPPEAGQPPFDLLVKKGTLPESAVPTAEKKRKDDDEPKRKGGSAMIVFLSGGFGLLFVLGGLSLTGWYLFTQIDYDTPSTTNWPGTRQTNSGGNRPNNSGGGGNNNGGGNTPGTPQPPPKPKDVFDLKPVTGNLPPITVAKLPGGDVGNVDLETRVGQIAVGGGGRYLVMHLPDKGQLYMLDVSTAQTRIADTDSGDGVRLAAGLSRAVVYSRDSNMMRVYSLPDMKKMYDATSPATGLNAIAMGSRTNGPLVGLGTFGDPVLIELGSNGLKEVEEARKGGLGLHWNLLRASPDGTVFTTFDGYRPGNKTTLLYVEDRKWKVRKDIAEAPFPGTDGLFYGNGVAMNRNGQDQRFGGVGAGSGTWYIPAVSGTGYFLKAAPLTVGTGAKAKKTMTVTIHNNKNADTPVAGTSTFSGLPEFDELQDRFGKHPAVMLDQHLFLIPEAKLLIVLNSKKDRLVLRKIDAN